MEKIVFFTDLDGTLLDARDYSLEEAMPAIARIKETKSALVFSTSKTRAETEEYEKKLGLNEPVIVENGGAIYIPKGYFSHEIGEAVSDGEWLLVKLGTEAKELEAVVNGLSKKLGVKAFHSMSIEELMTDTGLSREQVLKAKQRKFIASFKRPGKKLLEEAKRIVEGKGYSLSVGTRYAAVVGSNDKGKAVKILIGHYRREFGKVFSVGLGDAQNDIGMLRACDRAFLLADHEGNHFSAEFEKVLGKGPKAWNRAVLDVLKGI